MFRLAVVTFAAFLAFSAPAFASSVTTPSVDNTTPSAAANARTVYRVTFSTSASGAFSPTDKITITLPAGTGTLGSTGGTIHANVRNVDVGSCGLQTALVLTCGLYSGSVINAGEQLTVTLRQIVNPNTTTPQTLTVSTTKDSDTAISNPYSISAQGQAGKPSAAIDTPSAAAGARTRYVVTFTVSGTGGLSSDANSHITLTLPNDVVTSAWQSGTIHDVTRDVDVGSCAKPTGTPLTSDCGMYSGSFVNGGEQLQLILRGLINGPAGAKQVSVVTTSDTPSPVSDNFSVVPGGQVSKPTVTISAPSSAAAGARSLYVVDFRLSGTGGMSSEPASQIYLSLPPGTGTSSWQSGTIHDATRNVDVGSCNKPDATLNSVCGFYSGSFANGGDELLLVLRGLTNGPTGNNKTVTVSTTSDLPAITSNTFAIVDGGQVTKPTVTIADPSPATGARTLYNVNFKLSATGGMSSEAGSQLFITLPPGTDTSAWQSGTIHDITGDVDVGSCGKPDANLNSTCGFYSGSIANAGDQLQVTLRGLINGPAGSDKTVTVNTTSDLPTVVSSNFQVVGGDAISAPTVDITTPSPAAGARTRYLVNFKLSATGGMSSEAGSQLFATLPPGTVTSAWQSGTIHDVTSGVDIGSCNKPDANLKSTCGFYSGSSADGGDRLQLILRGLINGPAGTGRLVTVSTTSDTPTMTSDAFAIVANQAVSSVAATTAGANPFAIVRLKTSSTGGLSSDAASQVTLSFPAGTTFPGYSSASLYDVDRATGVGSCSQSGVTITCGFFSGSSTNPGDRLQVSFPSAVNPGTGTLSVSTTSDTAISGSISAGDTVAPDTTLTPSGSQFTIGSTEGGSFECRLDSGPWSACASPYTPPVVAGTHTLFARAVDLAGNADPTPASRNFTGTGTLDTTITGGPSGTTSDNTPTFTFTGNGVGFQCSVDGGPFSACDSPYTVGWSDGAHEFEVRAVDAANVTDSTPVDRTFTVATGAPTPPTVDPPTGTDSATPTFTFSGSGSFECSLDGGGFASCNSPYTTPALANGAHTFAVRTRDGSGTTSAPTARTFTVSVPVVVQPTPIPTTQPPPTPTATPAPTPSPTPTAGKEVTVQPSGTVLVKLKGTNKFVALKAGENIPYGSEVDATKGKVTITAGAPPQTADFYDGVFKLSLAPGGITNLTLSGPLAACPKKKAGHAAAKKPKTRRLWGSGKGNFRTTGKYSAATIRGTTWLVQDSCAGTLTKVTQGVVSVNDFTAHKAVVVKAGRSYTAKPKKG